jgi:hypothetical protein
MKTREELEKLTTPRLLSYLKSKREQWVSKFTDDVYTDITNEHLNMVREILSTREHIEKK